MIPFLFQVEYVTMKGWKSSIEDVREYDKLPKEAKQYLETIEELVQVPILWIGVGKGRESIISK
ncbi:adenylosuccinate synthetase-like isoform X2 [Diaphorina citri]|uniref:Adenylosuccinate synthetase-like isoform X1 n=1 Tax=Diaphorina citri TaxID=121845 RepID=A0A3Q0JMY8_DIACI|nr:adenylosuccinate synthetase-like isoform X1 [Diaphorina citri]XP_026688543.1 adenylosuccinate synthetase-like isoform X2 [Diaphorina citri]